MPIMETGQEDVGEAAVTRNEARRTSSDLANRDELLAATLLAETRAGDGNSNEVKVGCVDVQIQVRCQTIYTYFDDLQRTLCRLNM